MNLKDPEKTSKIKTDLEESKISFNFLQIWLREALFKNNEVYRVYEIFQRVFPKTFIQDLV